MKPVLTKDLVCAARAVLSVPRSKQASVAQALIVMAETADWHRRQYGEAHPHFGDGTLAGAAHLGDIAPERSVCDAEFATALIVVLQTVLRRSIGKASLV